LSAVGIDEVVVVTGHYQSGARAAPHSGAFVI
jgi:hypothetical protein